VDFRTCNAWLRHDGNANPASQLERRIFLEIVLGHTCAQASEPVFLWLENASLLQIDHRLRVLNASRRKRTPKGIALLPENLE
jgi:hypothetical protein